MSDLLPEETIATCPFCGSSSAPELLSHSEIEKNENDEDEGNPDSFAVCCSVHEGGCGAVGGYQVVKTKALKKWNTRVTPERIVYFPCTQHMGLPFTMTVGFAPPTRSVCPICEPSK